MLGKLDDFLNQVEGNEVLVLFLEVVKQLVVLVVKLIAGKFDRC